MVALDIGAIPEDIVMLCIDTITECIASGHLVGAAEALRHGGVAIRNVATMRRVMGPDIVGDVGVIEDVVAG